MTPALAIASVLLDAGVLVVVVLHFLYSHRAHQRRHNENIALLAFIEVQIRKTRHAVKNVAAALNMQAVVADLVDGNGDDLIDEEVANR